MCKPAQTWKGMQAVIFCLCSILPCEPLQFTIWKLMAVSVGGEKLSHGRKLQISIWNPQFNVGILNGCLISKLGAPGSWVRLSFQQRACIWCFIVCLAFCLFASFGGLAFGEAFCVFINMLSYQCLPSLFCFTPSSLPGHPSPRLNPCVFFLT